MATVYYTVPWKADGVTCCPGCVDDPSGCSCEGLLCKQVWDAICSAGTWTVTARALPPSFATRVCAACIPSGWVQADYTSDPCYMQQTVCSEVACNQTSECVTLLSPSPSEPATIPSCCVP